MTTFVFVHLNSRPPLYLILNIQSIRRKFPDRKVVLIHNQSKFNLRLKGLVKYQYSGSDELNRMNYLLKHPKEFRGNFWFTSIARFDALREYIQNTGESVVHIESDVIISNDFPIEKFERLNSKVAYPVVAQNRGVASTLYLKDLDAARLLVTFSTRSVSTNGNTSDMEILASLATEHEREVFQLAFAPPEDFFFHNNANNNLEYLKRSIEHFNGIFDGNDIGVYLFGSDPRNKRGYSLLRAEIPNNFAAIKRWRFLYDASRNFPSMQVDENPLAIYSVHATCKQIFLFWHVTREMVMRRQIRRQLKPPTYIFYPRIFTEMAIARLLRGKGIQK